MKISRYSSLRWCLETSDVAAIPPKEPELGSRSFVYLPVARREILRILTTAPFQEKLYVVAGFHKRFLVVTKIVDLLFEPLAHAGGIDLYERGANLAMANLLFATLPTFVGRPLFNSLLERFVPMVREPSDDNIDTFYHAVKAAYEAASPDNLKDELGALLVSRRVVERDRDNFDASSLGIGDPVVLYFMLLNGPRAWERLSTSSTTLLSRSKTSSSLSKR